MLDLTTPPPARRRAHAGAGRRSFRARLLRTVGPPVVGALAALCLVAWGAAYVTLSRGAVEVLAGEVGAVRAELRLEGDTLRTGGVAWDEAHHRLAVPRVDPIFVHVFDAQARLVRASANVGAVPGFPRRLLAARTPYGPAPRLRTFETGGRTFYFLVEPVYGPEGALRGYVQAARLLPDHSAFLVRFALALGGAWLLLAGGLLALVAWAARRVLRPLRAITAFAEGISPAGLRGGAPAAPIPPDADRETARLAATLGDLVARLAAAIARLRTFTADAAHELQTPITVLRGHVEVALRRPRSPERYRATLELLDDKLDGLVRTLRALLTLARLDRSAEGEGLPTQGLAAQGLPAEALPAEPVDLARLVREAAAPFAEAAAQKGVRVRQDVPAAPVWVRGQPDLLREAVRNLLDNAVKYTPEGSVAVALEVEADAVRVVCADTGVGIAAADLPRVSDRFYRSAQAGQVSATGSGLGLSLVARIAELHGGALRAASTPGKGSRFVLDLPRARPPTPSEAAPSEAAPSEAAPSEAAPSEAARS